MLIAGSRSITYRERIPDGYAPIAESALLNRQVQAACATRISTIPVCNLEASAETRTGQPTDNQEDDKGEGVVHRSLLCVA